MHSSPEHPDTIHNRSPVPPTTALQESTDIFMYGGKKPINQYICYSTPPYGLTLKRQCSTDGRMFLFKAEGYLYL